MAKYYAVQIGKTPGVYNTWDECKSQIEGVKGAKYKSYSNPEDALKFVKGELDYDKKVKTKVEITEKIYSFVDGSYNPATKVYGCGGFLVVDDEKYIIQGSASDEEMASMRNVAGEILGSMLAIKKAIELGLKKITIYYDYLGIEMWGTDKWEATKKGTKEYKEFIANSRKVIDIKFKKVKGHSGIKGNEMADKLAKESVGVK